jgi:radical SAM superfamily enzyme YgiQ (UPF0313 family)
LLKLYRKGYTASSVAQAFVRAQELGLRTVGTFVIGLPEETEASLEATLKLAIELDLDFMSLNVAVPRFGTEFRAKAVEKGLTDRDDLVMDQGGQAVALQTGSLNRATMLSMKKKMVRRFYLRPSYLWRRLRSASSLQELTGQFREGLALLSRNR